METLIAEAMKIMPLGQILVVGLLFWIGRSVNEVRESVGKLTVELNSAKEWQKGHEKLDDMRHQSIMETLAAK